MKNNDFIDFFSGSEVEVVRVKDLLEQENIPFIVQNDFNSGNLGGFMGGTPSTIRLKVQQSDFEKSKAVIKHLHPF